ncbi:MAG TPA: DUF134 domain-containing protein [Firmicutes bacterium]|nr:DUF134 domain-containing protein [Bacillota bacterium]
MPRPAIPRHIGFRPQVISFKPAGVPLHTLDTVVLGLAELEALRLKDKLGLDQEKCAEHMRISRPTFQRILVSARHKVATALINGWAIQIEGADGGNDTAPSHLSENSPEIHNTIEGFCPHCDRAPGPGHRWRRGRHHPSRTDEIGPDNHEP